MAAPLFQQEFPIGVRPSVVRIFQTVLSVAVALTISACSSQLPAAADRTSPVSAVSYFYLAGAKHRVENATGVGRATSSGSFFVDQIGVLKVESAWADGTRAPVVLVPGFGLAGHIYLTTADGRPGWAYAFVEAGHDVYIVDRAHTTRTAFNVFSFNDVKQGKTDTESLPSLILWLDEPIWTRWGLGPVYGEAFDDGQFPVDSVDQLMGSFAPVISETVPLQDQAKGNVEGLVALLEKTGEAIVITHSASGADGFRIAIERPSLVAALVSIEPVGCRLELAAGLAGVPTLSVFGDNFQVRKQMIPRFEKCKALASQVSALGGRGAMMHLPELGVNGNSHIMMSDYNSEDIAQRIMHWLNHE